MAILFVQHWGVRKKKEKEYENFVMNTHMPVMERLGLRVVGGFYVVVGAGPHITAISTTNNIEEFQKIMTSAEYTQLLEQLFPLIMNYSSKLLVSYGPIEVDKYEIQFGIWKFNQYFDIIPGMVDEYNIFVRDKFIPEMEGLGIKITNIWKVVIGSGPFMQVEGSSSGIQNIAKAIDTDEYRALMRELKSKYIMNFQSRILAPTRKVEIPYFIKNMTMGLRNLTS
jgi:hypothetical protein